MYHNEGIEFAASGQADVHWTESESHGTGNNRTTESISYRSTENYFLHKFLVQEAGKFHSFYIQKPNHSALQNRPYNDFVHYHFVQGYFMQLDSFDK